MKRCFYRIILLLLTVLLGIVIMPKKVFAELQANKDGTSLVSVTADDFFTLIKGMEVGTLAKSNQGVEDGIDCHMAKNTEWGGAALLAVSPRFGANDNNGSTTGNASGIYQMGNGKYEYTANYIIGNTKNEAQKITAGGKYSNGYSNNTVRIDGDALNMSSTVGNWVTNGPVLARGYGSLFNSVCRTYTSSGSSGNGGGGVKDGNVSSRAAVVNGEGL